MKTFIKTLATAGLGLIGSLGAAQAGPYDSAGCGILPGGCYGDSTDSVSRSGQYGQTGLPLGCDFGYGGGLAAQGLGPTTHYQADRYDDFGRNSAWKEDWLRSTSGDLDRYRLRSYGIGDDPGYDRVDSGYGRSTRMFEPWPGRSIASHRTDDRHRW